MMISLFLFEFHYNFLPVTQYVTSGSNGGLEPHRRQAIIWTDDGLGYWHIYA